MTFLEGLRAAHGSDAFLPEKRRKAPGFIHGDIRRLCEPSE